VWVVTDNDPALAQASADELARWIWNHRMQRYHAPMSVREGLRRGEKIGRYPIILADHADNPGGGAPADSTEILRTFLDLELKDALLLQIVDPEVAGQACGVGAGARLDLAVGGKSHPMQGPAVEGMFEIVATTDGAFQYDGPMFAGLDMSMGPRHGCAVMGSWSWW
jgi:microcystin degradation protein MlrC